MDCTQDKFVNEMEMQLLVENHSETLVEDDPTKEYVALITVRLPTRQERARHWDTQATTTSSGSKTSKEQLYSLTNLRNDPVSLCVVGVLQTEVDAFCSKHNWTGNSKRFRQFVRLLVMVVLILLACFFVLLAAVDRVEVELSEKTEKLLTICVSLAGVILCPIVASVAFFAETAHRTSPEFQAAMQRFECGWQEFECNMARILEPCGYGLEVQEKSHGLEVQEKGSFFAYKIARMYGFEGQEESLLLHEEKKLLVYQTTKGRNPTLPAPLENNDMPGTELEQSQTVKNFYGIKDMYNIQNNGILEYHKPVDPQDHSKEEPPGNINNNDNPFAPLDLWTSAGLMFGRTLNLNGLFSGVGLWVALVVFYPYAIGSLLIVILLVTRWIGLVIVMWILLLLVVPFVAFKVAFHFYSKPTLDRFNAELASVLSPLICDRHGGHTLHYDVRKSGNSVFVLEPPLDGRRELLRPID
jgi:hypothetical protein